MLQFRGLKWKRGLYKSRLRLNNSDIFNLISKYCKMNLYIVYQNSIKYPRIY